MGGWFGKLLNRLLRASKSFTNTAEVRALSAFHELYARVCMLTNVLVSTRVVCVLCYSGS